ncbi:hypothetical protein JW851_01100 [Candidatus Woesearchaeota archaeon]|nr:hypothetical protein [Candidatus Woesearchaeota archaeon]
MKNIRLSMIILDVVAIIAILGVILLADMAEQREMAKLSGQPTYKIDNVVQSYPDKDNPCKKVICSNYDPAEQIAWDKETDIATCRCGNGELFLVERV